MKDILQELTEMFAITALTLVGYFLISEGMDYFLILTVIVAIAGLAGYRITKLPGKPVS